MDVIMDAYVILVMDVIMDVIMYFIMYVMMVYNSVIMGIKDTLFTFITFVIMVYNGVIMETRFADAKSHVQVCINPARLVMVTVTVSHGTVSNRPGPGPPPAWAVLPNTSESDSGRPLGQPGGPGPAGYSESESRRVSSH